MQHGQRPPKARFSLVKHFGKLHKMVWNREQPTSNVTNNQMNKPTDEQREKRRRWAKEARDRLSDGYVRSLLTRNSCLVAADIPKNLVGAKKAHLLVTRTLRAIEKGDEKLLKQLDLIAAELRAESTDS